MNSSLIKYLVHYVLQSTLTLFFRDVVFDKISIKLCSNSRNWHKHADKPIDSRFEHVKFDER